MVIAIGAGTSCASFSTALKMQPDNNDITQTIHALMQHVQRLTGLPSRWNGLVYYNEETDMHGNPVYLAKKDWGCSITMHVSVLTMPNAFATLVHECLHSVSVGLDFPAFRDFRGYEEGVVEKLTRLFGPLIAAEMQVSLPFENRDSFNDVIKLLDQLRGLTAQSEELFYLELLKTPLASREQTVIQWIMNANPEENEARILAKIAYTLRGLRGRQ